jgi:hypothetical protein
MGISERLEMPVISKKVCKGQQDVVYTEIIKTHGTSIRIDIRSDAYAFQSHARCHVFSDESKKWNLLVETHYAGMRTPHKLYVAPFSEASFKADRIELVAQASELLGIPFA